MRHYLHYFGPEKLKRAIWCELFVIHEGYILYLEKWSRLRDSPATDVKVNSSEGDPHSDIQHLVPGGSTKVGNSQKVAKSRDTTQPFGKRN